jgi:hypothetical protein
MVWCDRYRTLGETGHDIAIPGPSDFTRLLHFLLLALGILSSGARVTVFHVRSIPQSFLYRLTRDQGGAANSIEEVTVSRGGWLLHPDLKGSVTQAITEFAAFFTSSVVIIKEHVQHPAASTS